MKKVIAHAKNTRLFTIGIGMVQNPLFAGSAIMIIGTNFSNILAYVYHLVMGRLLGPAGYGELAAMISLLALLMTTFSFVGLVVVKYVSAASNKKEKIAIFSWTTQKAITFGLLLSILFALLSPLLSTFLNIDQKTILILAPFFLFSILSTVYRSFLQGLLRFKEVILTSNLDLFGRLVLGVVFVYAGLSVFGGVLGIVIGSFSAFLLARFFLREYRATTSQIQFDKINEVISYAIPTFVVTASTLSLFSTDVILVKHFFNAHDAGLYAALSTLGRIIYFSATPVAAVMFPMVSRKHSKGEGYIKIFSFGLILTALLSLIVLTIYWVLPEFAIKTLYGTDFLEASPLLFQFGLFTVIFTLSNFMIQFSMSRFKTSVSYLVLLAALAQALGIWFFHNSTTDVINVSLGTSSLLLVSLLIYFAYDTQKESRKTA